MSPNESLLDEFCDTLWLEDGLARNTLESYRRDVRLFGAWLQSMQITDAAGRLLPASAQHPALEQMRRLRLGT